MKSENPKANNCGNKMDVLAEQFEEEGKLNKAIKNRMEGLGYGF